MEEVLLIVNPRYERMRVIYC